MREKNLFLTESKVFIKNVSFFWQGLFVYRRDYFGAFDSWHDIFFPQINSYSKEILFWKSFKKGGSAEAPTSE